MHVYGSHPYYEHLRRTHLTEPLVIRRVSWIRYRIYTARHLLFEHFEDSERTLGVTDVPLVLG